MSKERIPKRFFVLAFKRTFGGSGYAFIKSARGEIRP